MSDLRIGSIPAVNTNKAIALMSKMYVNAINKKISFKSLPSVMLWGQPGIGKSQAVRQLASEIEYNTGKRVNITDVRLMLFNPVDLRGIPTSNADKTLAIWLKPQIFNMDTSDNVVNILFLDEISAAAQSVQAAAYQITLDRVIGEHRLNDNCIVIAAGNRTTDKSVSYQMPKALANRLLHLEMVSDFNLWNSWAILNGIHKYVLGFLKFKPDYLNKFDSKNNEYAFATPRTWEMVSNILNNITDNIDEAYELIAGLVGKGVAVELKTWARVYKSLPSIEDIFSGREKQIPSSTDSIYALVTSMLEYARIHKDELHLIENSISYATSLPPDFSVILLKDYLYLDKDYKQKLLRIPEYSKWLSKKGRLLDAANGF